MNFYRQINCTFISLESMGATVAADAGRGVDCVGCACDDSVVVVGEQEVAGAPPSV